MPKRGSLFVPDPQRGLEHRDKCDELCHFDASRKVNLWLFTHMTTDPNNHTGLRLVGVNIDGPTRPGKYTCVWHPKSLALQLKSRLLSAETGSEEDKILQVFSMLERFERFVYNYVGLINNKIQTQNDDVRRQDEWERRQLELDC